MALAAASAATSAVGSMQQGRQQKKAAQAQAQVAANNAAIAEQNAKDAIVAGQQQEQQNRMEHNQRIGAMRAGAGASGIDVGAGSALDAVGDAAMMKEYDTLSIRDQAARQANNSYQQAADFTTQGNMATVAGKNAQSNGMWGAAGSLMSGAGQVAGSWYKMKQNATPATPALPVSTIPWSDR
jgi:glucan-binding YG repeat protein